MSNHLAYIWIEWKSHLSILLDADLNLDRYPKSDTLQAIGDTHTSLAKKKARLIFAKLTKEVFQSSYPLKVYIPEMEKEFIHFSNLISINKLDIGTRFFLEYIR